MACSIDYLKKRYYGDQLSMAASVHESVKKEILEHRNVKEDSARGLLLSKNMSKSERNDTIKHIISVNDRYTKPGEPKIIRIHDSGSKVNIDVVPILKDYFIASEVINERGMIKKGVDKLYSSDTSLHSIGNPSQYSDYINSKYPGGEIVQENGKLVVKLEDKSYPIGTKQDIELFNNYVNRKVKKDGPFDKIWKGKIELEKEWNFENRQIFTEKSRRGFEARVQLSNLLEGLSKKFGINYKIDNTMNKAGEFRNGIVYINPELMREDTPFHEFAHPFIAIVKKKNPKLYKNLVKEVEEEGAILFKTDRIYRPYFVNKGLTGQNLENAILEEAIVQAVGEFAAEILTESENKGLWQAIKNFLKDVSEYIKSFIEESDKKIVPSEINPNTTIREIAALMNIDNQIILGNVNEILQEEISDNLYAQLNDEELLFYKRQLENATDDQAKSVNDLINITKKLQLNKKGTKYINKENKKEKYDRTSDYIKKQDTTGRFAFDGDENLYEDNRQWGNILDLILYGVVLDIPLSEIKYNINVMDTKGASIDPTQVVKMYNKFKEIKELYPDSVLMTQITVANPDINVAGTMDVIIVHPSGALTVVDLKSSIKEINHNILESEQQGKPVFDDYQTVGADGRIYVNNYNKGFTATVMKDVTDENGNVTQKEVKIKKASKYETHQAQQSFYKGLLQRHGFNVVGTWILGMHITETEGSMIKGVKEDSFFELEENENWAELGSYMKMSGNVDISLSDSYQTTLDKVMVLLQKRLDALKVKKVKNLKFKKRSIERIQNLINENARAKQLKIFIEDAHKLFVTGDPNSSINKKGWLQMMIDQHKKIEKIYKDTTMDSSERELLLQNAIDDMVTFYNASKQYSVLDDIKKLYNEFKEMNVLKAEKGSPLDMLREAIEARDSILSKFNTITKPLIAEILYSYAPDTAKKVDPAANAKIKRLETRVKNIKGDSFRSKKKRDVLMTRLRRLRESSGGLTIDKILADLDSMSTDSLDMLHYGTSPLSNSRDSVLALFAKLVKSKFEQARQNLITFKRELIPLHKEFLKETGRSNNLSSEKLYEGMYEDITTIHFNEDKKAYELVKRRAFVQEFDVNAYNEKKIKMLTKLRELRGKAADIIDPEERKELRSQVNMLRYNFYKENHEILPQDEIIEILKEKLEERDDKLISDEDFADWLYQNVYDKKLWHHVKEEGGSKSDYVNRVVRSLLNGDTSNIKADSKELTRPSLKKFRNEKWSKIYHSAGSPSNAVGKLHNHLIGRIFKSQERLGETFQKRGDYKRYILPSIAKVGYDRVLENKMGKGNYIGYKMDSIYTGQSEDVELLGMESAGDKIIPTLFTQYMAPEDVSVDLLSSTIRFENMSLRFEAANQVQSTATATLHFVKDRTIVGTSPTGKKIIDVTAKKLGIDEKYVEKHKDADNIGAAWLEQFIDMQIFGELQHKEEYAIGRLDKFVNKLISFMSHTQFLFNPLLDVANSLQARVNNEIEIWSKDHLTRTSWLKAKKDYATYTLKGEGIKDFFEPMSMSKIGQLVDLYDIIQGEFLDNAGRRVSAGQFKKLWNTDTLFRTRYMGEHQAQVTYFLARMYETKVMINGVEKPLIEAYVVEDGVLKLVDGVELTGRVSENGMMMEDLQNHIHKKMKDLHGVYNSFDQAVLKRHALGRLLMMWRSWVLPGYRRRYGRSYMDFESGEHTEGYYRTFANLLISDLAEVVKFYTFRENELEEDEKIALRKTATEIMILFTSSLAAAAMVKFMMGGADDKKKKKLGYIAYSLYRLNAEVGFFVPWAPGGSPMDVFRIASTPSISTTLVEKVARFTKQIFSDPFETYQRDAGWADKGDNKALVQLMKIFGMSGVNIDPEHALKVLMLHRN